MTDTRPKLTKPLWSTLNLQTSTIDDVQRRSESICSDPRFMQLCAKLPLSDVASLSQIAPDQSRLFLTATVVLNRLNNPICNFCLDKKDTSKLLVCDACNMTFYCSEKCQHEDWLNPLRQSHRDWCCNSTAKPDEGPLQMILVKMKT